MKESRAQMGFVGALIGAFLGLLIGRILMFSILSESGSQFDPATYAIFAYYIPILFGIYGAMCYYWYRDGLTFKRARARLIV